MDFLAKILAAKQAEIAEAKRRTPLETLKEAAERRGPARGFCESLAKDGCRIIAEIKRASPSKGDIKPDLDSAAVARAYEAGGAACLSVLTEPAFFKGSAQDFSAARAAVNIPVLRKDFIVDDYQVYETAALHADAMLLIVRCLPQAKAIGLLRLALSLRLDVLVECYDDVDAMRIPGLLEEISPEDIKRHVAVGINNRDLTSFATDVHHAEKVSKMLPKGILLVALSGSRSQEDLQTLAAGGIRRFLVGEALVRAGNPEATLRAWLSKQPAVKICGLRDAETALFCAQCGAAAIGTVFYPQSPRAVTPMQAREIFATLPREVARVGVFVDLPLEKILAVAAEAGLTTVQLHGAEPLDEVAAIQQAGYRVVKAVKTVEACAALPESAGVLLECSKGVLPGGNGAGWDWGEAKSLLPRSFAIAGGLAPQNLLQAAELSGAVAFDVSSGVESAPGVKDRQKIAALLSAAKCLSGAGNGFWK